MKPRNFPGRKLARRERAKARLEGQPMLRRHPTIDDIRWRFGGKNRGPDGVPTGEPRPRTQSKDGAQ